MSLLDLTSQALPLGAGDVDTGRLDALRRMAPGEGKKAAAGELEVMFLTQLIQAMRRTIPQDDFLPPSPARSVYEGAFDRAVASSIAERDPLGMVRALGADPGPAIAHPGEARGLKLAGDPADTVTGHQDRGKGTSRP